jgi:hypothetical protein
MRTRVALARKKAQGALLGNRTGLKSIANALNSRGARPAAAARGTTAR